MDLKDNDLDLDKLNMNKEFSKNNANLIQTNKNNLDEDVYFYIMTLQANGQRHQIKIFENSNASELAFNFCKTYNLDFPTMKYLKKCIKQIILHFNSTRKNEMIYLLKDNSSISEVAEEEIATDNSLKKAVIHKKNNSNDLNLNNKENKRIKKNFQISSNKDSNKKNIFQKFEEKNKEKAARKNNGKEIIKPKNSIENDGQFELKDYSIDYCLENESVEIFPPTQHTTKIEQKSSIKNSYFLNQKKNSKNKKLQINNNSIIKNRINGNQKNIFNLNKMKKEKYKNNNDINDKKDLKNILMQNKGLNIKKKNKIKRKSNSKSKSKEKRFSIDKEKYFINQNTNPPKSLEKIEKNKTKHIDNKKNEFSKNVVNKKINKHEKFLKNKYYSNYYDYFTKIKNFNNKLTKASFGQKHKTSYSLNQESNRSKSISQHKINKNLTQKISMINKNKKRKIMIHLNSINHQLTNNNSKLNLSSVLKKDYKEQQRNAFKNKLKTNYNIIYKKNNSIFCKMMNRQCLTSRNKLKNIGGKELFMESKKINENGIKKMVTESLLNMHKLNVSNKEKKKKNINMNNRIVNCFNNKKKISRNREIILKNETSIEKSINLQEKLRNNNTINFFKHIFY